MLSTDTSAFKLYLKESLLIKTDKNYTQRNVYSYPLDLFKEMIHKCLFIELLIVFNCLDNFDLLTH